MPFQTDMVYIRYEFNCSLGDEIQVTGLWAHLSNDPIEPTLNWDEAVYSIAAKAVESWASNVFKDSWSKTISANRVVVYHYDQAHNVILDRGEAGFTGDNAWASTASQALPPQNSLVLSLYGYDPAGYAQDRASKRGRMYLPTPAPQVLNGSTGSMDPTSRGLILGSLGDWLEDLGGNINVPGVAQLRPQIVSKKLSINTPVDYLRLGLAVDTVRSRRSSVPENYLTVPLEY